HASRQSAALLLKRSPPEWSLRVANRSFLLTLLIGMRRLAVGGLLLYVLVALTLGGIRPARPVFCSCLIVWAVFLFWRSYRGETSAAAPNTVGWVELIATNLALTLVLAEIGLRAWSAASGPSLLVSCTLEDHRLVPDRDYGAGLRGNNHGYPGSDFVVEK